MGKLSPSALRLSALLISTCYLDFCAAAGNPVFQDHGYYEGNRCDLENGEGEGVCAKLTDCSSRMLEIKDGRYSGADRCGFTNFEEIVCCAEISRSLRASEATADRAPGRRKRAAESACETWAKMFNEIEASSALSDGVEARPGRFPQMAALGYAASEPGGREALGGMKYVCAGALISQKHVLTAAHCVSNARELVPLEVMLGAADAALFDPKLTQRIPISRIVNHPRYDQSLDYHDIAILELRDSANLSTRVRPACLATEPLENGDAGGGRSLTALGWGAPDPGAAGPPRLLRADGLELVDKKSCSKAYENARARMPDGLDDGVICAADVGRSDGGPLLASTGASSPVVGVASLGGACGLPGVYVSVYDHLEWIEARVWPRA